MSRKSAQARQKATAQAKAGVRPPTTVQTRPTVRPEVARKGRSQAAQEQSHKASKARGGALTTWLIIVLVMNALTICLTGITLVMNLISHQPLSVYWSVIAALIICPLAIISTIGILKWKKRGFYLFMGIASCAFLLDIVLGQFIVISHTVSTTNPSVYSTNTHVYITWPVAACLMWFLVHSKKRWPMFE